MLLRDAIGTTLRRLRLDAGRTLREVSDAAAISVPYLSEIERGRKEVSSEVLAGILRALGITLVDLLREVAEEQRVIDLAAERAARLEVARAERVTAARRGPAVSLAA